MEKNLAQIFADAERTNCMLFFDEADAIFGRRGEIKEAHDRWANLEVNYLLQAVERHKGVVILATNFRQNIDEAFQRRIHVIVEFPMPDAASRREIWARLLPSGDRHSVPDAALTELADRFELSGGNIRNVVVDACYRAMGTPDRRLTTQHLVAGLVREYQKVVRPVTLGEFGQPFYDYAMAVLTPEAEPAAAGGQ
jgi:SpoVK/Ycf46/Vps4 family AAA+-type ATPase